MWSTIDDLSLSLIYGNLPLALLFGTLSIVCAKWSNVQRIVLRSHKNLVLVGDSGYRDENMEKLHIEANPIGCELLEKALCASPKVADSTWAREVVSRRSIDFNRIRLPGTDGSSTLGEQITDSLLDKFESLHHLTVVLSWYCNPDSAITSLEQLARMLDGLADHLISLKLDLNYHGESINPFSELEYKVEKLFESINRLTKLKHITLNVHFECNLWVKDFAFLARVHSFTTHQFMVGRHPAELLLAALRQYATDGPCAQIDIDLTLEWDGLKELDPQLTSKFSRIAIDSDIDEDDLKAGMNGDMQLLGDRFVSLTSLELEIGRIPITTISRCLSRLTGLIHLSLDYSSSPKFETGDDLEITPLPSVRMLTLHFKVPNHSFFERQPLGQVLPNLQVLLDRTNHITCGKCRINLGRGGLDKEEFDRMDQEVQVKLANCICLILKSFFRKIPSLRLVQYDPRDTAVMRSKATMLNGWFTEEELSSRFAIYVHAPTEILAPGTILDYIPGKIDTRIR